MEEVQRIAIVDLLLPTKAGIDIRKRCVTQPAKHQAIQLQRLGLTVSKGPRM